MNRRTLASLSFLSRWLQAPLYVGLIVAQAVYVYRFVLELGHLIGLAFLAHVRGLQALEQARDAGRRGV